MELDPSTSDQGLVSKALGGDQEAFGILFGRYRDGIMNGYLRKGNSAADADDMVQDTFIKVFINLGKFNPEYSFARWINTIARNILIDHIRRRRERTLSLDTVAGDELRITPAAGSPSPEQEMIISQSNAAFDKVLQSLPEMYREIIILRFFREYSYEEISAELSMPIGTVKTHIHRARERLFRLIYKNDI